MAGLVRAAHDASAIYPVIDPGDRREDIFVTELSKKTTRTGKRQSQLFKLIDISV